MPKKKTADDYDANFDMCGSMAHYVADRLNLRPAEILDTWSVPELLVTYGQYANQETKKALDEWKSLDTKQRQKYPRPREYAVYFMGVLE